MARAVDGWIEMPDMSFMPEDIGNVWNMLMPVMRLAGSHHSYVYPALTIKLVYQSLSFSTQHQPLRVH